MVVKSRAILLTAFLAVAALAAGQTSARLAMARSKALLRSGIDIPYSPDTILVRFKPGATESQKHVIALNAHGERVQAMAFVGGMELMYVPNGIASGIASMQGQSNVLYAEPNWVVKPSVTPNDTFYANLWGMTAINAPQAWDIATGDPNFVVAMIDTGIQITHPDLAANIWTNPGESAGNGQDDDADGYIDDIHGWNFLDDSADVSDLDGHGTHTAGTVGAVGDNGLGVTGVNWHCKLMPLKFLGPDGGFISDAILALQYAVHKNVKVSNNSWGGAGFSQSMRDAIASAKSSGHLFVAAAGNNGQNNNSAPVYPGAYDLDNIVTVAAIDSNGLLASFSNYSTTSVDLGAPGVGIMSTIPDGYDIYDGTSMAAPHVTGAISLLWSQHPTWTYRIVRDRIFATVHPLGSLANATKTGGRLDLYAALHVTNPIVAISLPTNNLSVMQGTVVSFSATASDTVDGSLSSGLAWTDSIQGAIGTGSNFNKSNLTVGIHTVTASVTDSEGLPGSATVTLTVNGPPPSAPTNLSISRTGSGTIRAQWADHANNETAFEIQREKYYYFTWVGTTTRTISANTVSFNDQPGAGIYQYRVRAINTFGASAWTGWVSIRP